MDTNKRPRRYETNVFAISTRMQPNDASLSQSPSDSSASASHDPSPAPNAGQPTMTLPDGRPFGFTPTPVPIPAPQPPAQPAPVSVRGAVRGPTPPPNLKPYVPKPKPNMVLYDIPMADSEDAANPAEPTTPAGPTTPAEPTTPIKPEPLSTPPPPSPSYASSSAFSTPTWDRPTPPPPPSPASLPRPRPPSPVGHPSHPGFAYSRRGLLYHSIPRFPPAVVKTLLARPPIDNRSGPWIAAQLALWGIPCPDDADAATQRRALEEAVLDEVPDAVREVEEAVKEVWEARAAAEEEAWRVERFAMCRTQEEEADVDAERFVRKYFPSGFGEGAAVPFPGAGAGEEPVVLGRLKEPRGLVEAVKKVEGLGCYVTERRGVVGWQAGLGQAVVAVFEGIEAKGEAWGDPWWVATAEAQFEMDRFLAKYFLDGLYGRPMPQKTPSPVTLRGWVGGKEYRHRLLEVVRCIPGLSLCWFVKEDGQDSCIIGWGTRPMDELRVLEAAKAQRVAEAEARRIEEYERPWTEMLKQEHFHYLRDRLVPPQGPFCVNHLVGSWLVKCPRIEADWGGKPGNMTLDIVDQPLSEHGVLAAWDMVLFRGTMLIAPDQSRLTQLSDAMSAYTSDDEARLPRGGFMVKKSMREAGAKPPRLRNNRIPEVEPGMGRVVLRWMGRRLVGEGEDDGSGRLGLLDLDMVNRGVGRGAFAYPAVFGPEVPVQFWVYKISDQPRAVAEKWSHFCTEPSPEYQYAFYGHSGWQC